MKGFDGEVGAEGCQEAVLKYKEEPLMLGKIFGEKGMVARRPASIQQTYGQCRETNIRQQFIKNILKSHSDWMPGPYLISYCVEIELKISFVPP